MKLTILSAIALSACIGLAACGHRPGDRALSGAAIGAGAGAIIGAGTGTAATGAAIGAGVGAIAGAATTPDRRDRRYRDRYPRECEYGPQWWDDHGGPREYRRVCD